MNNRATGIDGETIATEFLQKKGFKIIERNYTTKVGEIDIIARDDDTIVFVEVKLRNSKLYSTGLDSVTPDKIYHIIKTAEIYLKSKNQFYTPCRFDVIFISGDEVTEYVPNAFTKNDAGRKKHW